MRYCIIVRLRACDIEREEVRAGRDRISSGPGDTATDVPVPLPIAPRRAASARVPVRRLCVPGALTPCDENEAGRKCVHETDQKSFTTTVTRISFDLVNFPYASTSSTGPPRIRPRKASTGGGYAAPSVSAGMATPLQTISSCPGLTPDWRPQVRRYAAPRPPPPSSASRLRAAARIQSLGVVEHLRAEAYLRAAQLGIADARSLRARTPGLRRAGRRSRSRRKCSRAERRAPPRTRCGAQSAASAISAYGTGNDWAAARGDGGGGEEGEARGGAARAQSSRAGWAAGPAGRWRAGTSEETQRMIPRAVAQVFGAQGQRQRLHDGGPAPSCVPLFPILLSHSYTSLTCTSPAVQEPITDALGPAEPPRAHEIRTTVSDTPAFTGPAHRGDAHERAHSVSTRHIREPHAGGEVRHSKLTYVLYDPLKNSLSETSKTLGRGAPDVAEVRYQGEHDHRDGEEGAGAEREIVIDRGKDEDYVKKRDKNEAGRDEFDFLFFF
ncbi:hypothetical protein FB451DRAFT_1440027 [Mycena latifolia]|nr:hypothetical protein FB451DRAFT_1440027 [Mycena latifolia]